MIGKYLTCGLQLKAKMTLITRINAFKLGNCGGPVLQVRNEDLSKVQP